MHSPNTNIKHLPDLNLHYQLLQNKLPITVNKQQIKFIVKMYTGTTTPLRYDDIKPRITTKCF